MAARGKVALFLEDIGHQYFVESIVMRLAAESGVSVAIDVRNARGGAPRLDRQFIQFLSGDPAMETRYDLVIVVHDTDCAGVDTIESRYKQLVQEAGYTGAYVVGAPEPHIECWYLADPLALQRVLHGHAQAPVPDSRCGRNRFKRVLAQTVRQAGIEPAEGGIEYGALVVEEMDIYRACSNVPSLARFVVHLRRAFRHIRD